MISDKLFSLAFEYKKTKLWTFLHTKQVFALKLSDGQIGYISVAGGNDCNISAELYIGENALDSFRSSAELDQFLTSPLLFQESLMRLECLQCIFDKKDYITEEEMEEIKTYAHSHGIRFSGKNPYPLFVRCIPYRTPWNLQNDQEQAYLCEALSACIALSEMLKEKRLHISDFTYIGKEACTIPMLEFTDGEYILGSTHIPKMQETKYPVPQPVNDIAAAKLKKNKKKSVLECELIRFPRPIPNGEDNIPVFPIVLLAVDELSEFLLPMSAVYQYEDNPDELMNFFIEACLEQNIRPVEIKVKDVRTYTFAQPFCSKLGIPLTMEEELPFLEEAEYEFLNRIDMNDDNQTNEIFELLDIILNTDEKDLNEFTPEMLRQLEMLPMQLTLPDEIEEKLNDFIQRASNPKQKRLTLVKPEKKSTKAEKSKVTSISSRQSYVISVSLGSGCYRHIQISEGNTLFQLHSAILEAFGFDDDHAHAFFMDNKSWSNWDCYYSKGAENPGDPLTCDYRLNRVGLFQGKQFKYIFDFGDEWTFQCKVLRILEYSTDQPVVIRSKGDAPSQYGDLYEDDWDDKDD